MILVDDATDPLAILAADRAAAGPARSRCAQVWPLLVVPPADLDADDRLALESHLATCGHCRATAIDAWLDRDLGPRSTGADASVASTVTAVAAVTPAAVDGAARGSRRRLVAALAGALVLAAVVIVVVGGVVGGGDRSRPAPRRLVTPAAATAPAVAVVIAYLGTEVWLGNDTYVEEPGDEPPPDDRPLVVRHVRHGAHAALGRALVALSSALPADSLVGLVAYDLDGARVVRPLASLAAVRLDAGGGLGLQRDYAGRIGTASLTTALERAGALLATTPARRRILVVVGDGCHAASEGPPAMLSAAGERLRATGVLVRAVRLPSDELFDCPAPMAALDPEVVTLAGAGELSAALRTRVLDR